MASAVCGWSPVTMMTRMPAAGAARDRLPALRAAADPPVRPGREGHAALFDRRTRGDGAMGEGEHAQARVRHLVLRREQTRARGGIERRDAGVELHRDRRPRAPSPARPCSRARGPAVSRTAPTCACGRCRTGISSSARERPRVRLPPARPIAASATSIGSPSQSCAGRASAPASGCGSSAALTNSCRLSPASARLRAGIVRSA